MVALRSQGNGKWEGPLGTPLGLVTGALEYLHGSVLAIDLDDLSHEFCITYSDVAKLILRYRAVDLYCHKV